jgi:hypothetical protein
MKNFDIGQAINVVANLGVIAGIFFLVIEIKQNNEALEAQSRHTWVDRQVHILETMALNPNLLEIMLKAEEAEGALTELDLERVRSIGLRTFAVWQHQYNEMERGRLAEGNVLDLQRAVFCGMSHGYGTRQAWDTFQLMASQEYVGWFEEKVIKCE